MNQFSISLPEIEELEILLEDLIDDEDGLDLVVFNDDVNTFDHVINVLMKVCKHSHEQAEQCTLIIHYKGKCAVKKGTREELKPLCQAILDAGIQAAIL
jgi:ATP-dependent Clp protease adaptor protein ClpS